MKTVGSKRVAELIDQVAELIDQAFEGSRVAAIRKDYDAVVDICLGWKEKAQKLEAERDALLREMRTLGNSMAACGRHPSEFERAMANSSVANPSTGRPIRNKGGRLRLPALCV